MLRLRRHAAAHAWRLGTVLAEVQRDRLWQHDSANSFTAWLRREFEMPYRSARAAMRVAAWFTEKTAATFGPVKLDAAVGWLEATREEERPGDLLVARVRIRGEGGTFRSVPFAEATAAQLRDATRLLLAGQRGADPVAARREALSAAAGLDEARIKVSADADGALRVSVTKASAAELRALADALDADG